MSGIYIHIPFCKQACHYCDFHFSTSLKKKDDLLSAINKELVLRKNELKNQTIETIYFGGGTPSLLSSTQINQIIQTVYNNYAVSNTPEITLEANPDDLSEGKIKDLANSPINRLSIGIQSFFENDLQAMNRAHTATESQKCLDIATKYFDNITIDLIYGIPNMTLEQWAKNLNIALKFNVNHISSYALTVEPKTALDKFIKQGTYPSIDDDLALSHFNYLTKTLNKAGYTHYEISNFGKPNFYSKHNTAYWQGKPYIGIGPSAHSYNKIQRSWNIANNSKYINAINTNVLPQTTEKLSVTDRYNEYIMIGLRTIWGIHLNYIKNEFGSNYKTQLLASIQNYIQQDILQINPNNTVTTTSKGKFLADGIAANLFI